MSRLFVYLSIAFVPLGSAPANTAQTGGFQPHNPLAFAKPFPAAEQQFNANPWQGLIPTTATPHGWEGQQLNYAFAKPFAAALQQYAAHGPEHVPAALDVEGWFGVQIIDYQFAKPFAATKQQYVAHTLAPIPVAGRPGWEGQQLSAVFAKPFPASAQQYEATFYQLSINTQAQFIEGWRNLQFDYAFKKPFPVSEQQYAAFQPQGTIVSITPQGFYPQPPDLFAKPFPAPLQQYVAHALFQVPTAATPHGWEGQQLSYLFSKPLPPNLQQYAAHVPYQTAPAPTPDGWEGQQLSYAFTKPFSVGEQQYSALGAFISVAPQGFYPQSPDLFTKPSSAPRQQYVAHSLFPVPTALSPHGWEGQQLTYAFTKAITPAVQQFNSFQPAGNLSVASPVFYGWWGYQFDYRFAKPFPVTEQVFSVWDLVGAVPPNLPPGSGKRRHFPSYIPQPAYEEKKSPPFRPVWDKPQGGEVERHPEPAARMGPPPLPPADIFSPPTAPTPGMPPGLQLPSFNEYAPPDPIGLGKRLRDVQDESDAMAVLKALGLFKG